MKKRIGLIFGLLLGFCAIGGACVSSVKYNANSNYIAVCAEGEEEPEEPAETPEEPEVFECQVVLSAVSHGKITADKMEGHVGDIVTLTVDPSAFYLVEYVKMNESNLIEDEELSDTYKFALVEGENKITANFVVNQELLGEMAVIYEQASNKDWTHLFSVENVFRIISILFSGGLLLTMVRYFIKDKRLADKVEKKVEKTVAKVVPETTKQVVTENIQTVIQPLFAQTAGYQEEIIRVLGILVKCIALMQEDTPESRRAVLAELANLNIGDMKVIEDARNFIDKYFAEKMNDLQKVMNGLDNIIEKNTEAANKIGLASNGEDKEVAIPKADNGIQI